MGIQIFGKSKCFDTQKAERYFKERGVKFQRIDLPRFGMSPRELESVKAAVGSLDALINEKAKGAEILRYLAGEQARTEKLLENPAWFKTPIVRCGRFASVGFCPEQWERMEG